MNLCYICYEYKIKQKDCYKRLMPNRFLISQPCHRSTGWPRSTDATSVRLRLILFGAAGAHRLSLSLSLSSIPSPSPSPSPSLLLLLVSYTANAAAQTHNNGYENLGGHEQKHQRTHDPPDF